MNNLQAPIWSGFVQRLLGLTAGLLIACQAHAASLQVRVRTEDGQPLQYAAVLARWTDAPVPQPNTVPAVMNQQNLAFEPHMLIVPVGSKVAFPNHDRTRHHVYSFSKTKTFDIKLYIGRPERPITFDKPGVVTLGCNIHDQMQAFIVATAAPRWAVTDARGMATLRDLPDAPLTLSIWHPWMNDERTRVQRVVAAAEDDVTVTLDVVPPLAPPEPSGPTLQDRFNELAH